MDRLRVLLVDDHPGFRASAAALLASGGLEVVAAVGSAEEALTLMDDVMVDLLLVDLMLPGIDGVDLARRVTAGTSPPLIVLISSHADAVLDPRVRNAPVQGFVSKRDLTCSAIRALIV